MFQHVYLQAKLQVLIQISYKMAVMLEIQMMELIIMLVVKIVFRVLKLMMMEQNYSHFFIIKVQEQASLVGY